jgi:transcription initiation factor TFIID TATA-box-binding protein
MVEIVNIVASGHFGREFDLGPLSVDLDAVWTQYEPETFPGLQVRFESNGPVMILYSTGTYTIMGAKSELQLTNLHEQVSAALTELGIEVDFKGSCPEIRNLICKGDLGREVNLEALVIGLGMENTEYEPEQSPFVYYWPEDLDCLITIPTNGEIIVTGVEQIEIANEALEHLQTKIESLAQGEK